ncbi:MAG: glycosyltransferase family 39 protein [Candidatus Acidiferrales bacterium]
MNGTSSSFAAGEKNNSERLAALGICILIAYAIVRTLFAAASRPLWYDELLTLIVTRQPSVSAIWRALAQSVDSQPPPFYLVERAAAALLRNPQIAFRLPSIFGFACTLVCVFFFVKRRSAGAYALFCAATLLVTALYSPYAIEARPYSLLVACIAIALLCYQRAPETGWMILMGLSFAAAEALHYYAVFALVPFGLAEIALSLKERRLRPGAWLALACGLLPLAVFWPLLLGQKRIYGAHFWAAPTLRHTGSTYGWLFHISSYHWNLAIAVAVVFFLVGAPIALAIRHIRATLMADRYFHEHVLVWALLGIPFVAFVATKLAHGGMDHRYVLASVLAVPLGVGSILPRLNRSIVVLLAILVLSVLAFQEARFWASQHGHLGEVVSPVAALESMLNSAGHPDLPVVISDGEDYLPFVHYAPPELSRRFVDVVDPPQAVAYIGNDTVDKDLLRLQFYYPLQVHEFRLFASNHAKFLLYSSGDIEWDWWPRRLARDGYSLEVLAVDQGHKVYLVTRNSP